MAALASFIPLSSTAHAADIAQPPPPPLAEPDRWEVRFTPYVWAQNLTGDAAIRGRDFEVNASFFDLIEESDSIVALMINGEARRGRFGIVSDFVYSRLTASQDFLTATNPVPGLSLTTAGDLGFETEILITEAVAAYEVFLFGGDRDLGGSPGAGSTAIDLLAGARYWRIDGDLSLGITGTIDAAALGVTVSGARALATSGTVDWIDPIVGFRVRYPLTPRQQISFRADVGGGIGGGSDFTWNMLAAYTWESPYRVFGGQLSGAIGYRALYADYTEGAGSERFNWDLLVHGPAFGLSLEF